MADEPPDTSRGDVDADEQKASRRPARRRWRPRRPSTPTLIGVGGLILGAIEIAVQVWIK